MTDPTLMHRGLWIGGEACFLKKLKKGRGRRASELNAPARNLRLQYIEEVVSDSASVVARYYSSCSPKGRL